MSQFQSLSEQYSDLYSSMFDADPASLQYITLYPTILVSFSGRWYHTVESWPKLVSNVAIK